jgi:hypothetical protein
MGEFVVEVAKDRFQGVSKVTVEGSARTSFLRNSFHCCGLLSLLIALNLLGTVAVRADTVNNAAGDIAAQLCPLLDSLTEAAISVAQSNRAIAATQLDSTISLADGLMATVQSSDMTAALGNKSTKLQKSLSRFQSQLLKAEAAVDNSGITDSAALKAILRAATIGQQLKALVPTLPSSDTVVMVREVKSSTTALHHAGNKVCFHVNILNAASDPSCGPVTVAVDPVGGDPTDVLVIGTPDFSTATDFCLTMGPDAGTLQVTVSTCNQTNSVLLYNYGVLRKAGTTLSSASIPPAAPSNLAVMVVTPTSITLDWQNNADNELGFEIRRASSPAGPWSVVGAVGTHVTSYTDTRLVPLTTYYYEVTAFN